MSSVCRRPPADHLVPSYNSYVLPFTICHLLSAIIQHLLPLGTSLLAWLVYWLRSCCNLTSAPPLGQASWLDWPRSPCYLTPSSSLRPHLSSTMLCSAETASLLLASRVLGIATPARSSSSFTSSLVHLSSAPAPWFHGHQLHSFLHQPLHTFLRQQFFTNALPSFCPQNTVIDPGLPTYAFFHSFWNKLCWRRWLPSPQTT